MLGRYGTLVTRHAEGQTRQVLRLPTLTAVDPARSIPGAVEAWADEAASRIVIIAETYRDRVARIIENGYDLGRSGQSIARDIERIGAATENRARLWARDQIATINAQATEAAQQRAGVTHYRWWTAQDERVRDGDRPGDNHRERQGVIFAWANPPTENEYDGHPGNPINCRCVAIPIPPDELDEELAEQAIRGNLPPSAAT
jgi:SPP1 gp7 family putative phage head morphogenesis protein